MSLVDTSVWIGRFLQKDVHHVKPEGSGRAARHAPVGRLAVGVRNLQPVAGIS